MHPLKYRSVSKDEQESTVLLEYTGSLTGAANSNVGIQIEIDTSLGIRYEVSFQNAGAVLSHTAFFYKFSNPYQTVFYNYLKHKSEVIKGGGTNGGQDVTVVGKEKIDSFSCTHLRQSNKRESQDYWMSTSVPGFKQVATILKNIDPNLLMMAIDGGIFEWGGLVKLKISSTTSKGQTTSLALHLIEAETGLDFPSSDFDVPK